MPNREEKEVIERFKHAVTEAFEDRLDRIVLFGSRARGEADEESDFDFLVIVRKSEKEDKNRIREITSDLSIECDTVIVRQAGSGLIFAIRWPRVSLSFRKPLRLGPDPLLQLGVDIQPYLQAKLKLT